MKGFLSAIFCLLASHAAAYPIVYFIGKANAAAGSATLVITTSAACPVNSVIAVGLGESATNVAFSNVVDSSSNAYSQLGQITGTTSRAGWFKTGANGGVVTSLPSGGTITVTYGNTTAVETASAFCILPNFHALPVDSSAVGTAATATGTNPAMTPLAPTRPNEIELVLTHLTAGSADAWTESTGYTSLTSNISGPNALRVAYANVPGISPAAYSATNSSSRVWITTNLVVSSSVCALGTIGAGNC